MTWEIWLAVAYLTLLRYAVKFRILPLSWALWLVAPLRATPPAPRSRQSGQQGAG